MDFDRYRFKGIWMKRQRFSKNEAMVVIVLVVLGLFLILSTGSRHWRYGQQRATQSECVARLKQLGTAATLYQGENSGNYPGPVPSTTMPLWDIALGIRYGNPDSPASWAGGTKDDRQLAIFVCYSDESAWVLTKKRLSIKENGNLFCWGFAEYYDLSRPVRRSYSMNLGNHEIAATTDKIGTGAIDSPAGTIQLCELHDQRNLLGKPELAALSQDDFIRTIFDGKTAPYHGTLKTPRPEALFYDGHVELLDEKYVLNGNPFDYKKSVKPAVSPIK